MGGRAWGMESTPAPMHCPHESSGRLPLLQLSNVMCDTGTVTAPPSGGYEN